MGTERMLKCQLRVLEQDDARNYNVEIDMLSSGPVQSGTWEFRNLEKYAGTFVGCPILCAYVGEQVGDGHNTNERIDPKTGKRYESFMGSTCERIVGSIGDNPEDVWVHEANGKTWVTARGKLWRFYAKELVDKIARQGRMDVSIEADVEEGTTETYGERQIFNDWTGYGVTILGDRVDPAVPNAHIRALAAMKEEFNTCKLLAAALEKKPQTKKTEGVKRSMNKTLLANLAKLFTEHTVIGCSEDCSHVLLLSKDGDTYSYQFKDDMPKDMVIAQNITPVTLSAAHTFEDGVELSVDSGMIFATLSAQLTASNSALVKAQEDLATAQNKIKTMQAAEDVRRQEAAANAVTAKLSAVNGSRTDSEKLDTAIADSLLAECKAGKFNACCAADGTWNGDKEAVIRLMALVGEEQAKQDELRKARRDSTKYAWEEKQGNGGNVDDIDAMLSRITGNT